MARSSTRAKPYVVEIQRHYYLDELDNRGKRGYRSRPPVATPKMTPRVHLNAPRSHEGEMSKARHVSMDPSRLKSGSLEYEDIYDRRDLSRGNSHFKPAGRWSLRDDGGYGRVHGNTRRSPGIARATEMRLMMNGDVRQQNGTVSDHGKMRASYKGGQIRTNEGPSHEQKRITRDKNDNQRDDLELWIARQTSFPKKQDEKAERTSNQRIPENDTVSHELKQSNSIHEKSRNVAPPTVFLKPPHPQTSRSASPAPSIRSNQSGASSHASHHSARSGTSEVSVKSILKKPKVGRVVLKKEPSSHTWCAVLSCILCFPFGIYSLMKSKQVKEAVDENDYELALSSSRKVKHFCFGVLLAYLGILAVVGALLAVFFITGKIF